MVRASSRAVSAARVAVAVLLALVLTPAVAHAWTPGTHIFLGEAITGWQWAGIALIVAALACVLFGGRLRLSLARAQ